MSVELSEQEEQQIRHTIEMFEVIAQSQPDDYQSFEILKEAYEKLGQEEKALDVSRKLARAYANMGQYSSAAMECEGILQKIPDQKEIAELLADLERKVSDAAEAKSEKQILDPVKKPDADASAAPPKPAEMESSGIMATKATEGTPKSKDKKGAPKPRPDGQPAEEILDDGNDALAKFLIEQQIAPKDVVMDALERVRTANSKRSGQALACCLLDEITRNDRMDSENLLSVMLDRIKFAYIPLEIYDIDRQMVKMLPEELTLGRLFVPFDLMSRTLMVALANPFDAAGRESAQQMVDYNIQWYLAPPDAIFRALRDSYRLDARD